MAAGVIASTYGHALFELAVEQQEIDRLMEEAGTVITAMNDNPELGKLYDHPRISMEEKVRITEDCFRDKVSNDMVGFLILMVRNGRQKEILTSLQDFVAEVKENRGVGICHVVSALPISEAQKARLVERLIKTTKYKSFEMHYEVDKKLIGGITIQIGDRVLDSSVRTQLNVLQKELQQLSAE